METILDYISKESLPSKKEEEWKYYDFRDLLDNVSLLQKKNSDNSQTGLEQTDLVKLVDKYVFRECTESLLVTVNGNYREDLSNCKQDDIIVSSLKAEDQDDTDDIFKSVNSKFIENAFFIKVKKNIEAKKTIQVLHISNQNRFNQIRSIIELEDGSSLNLVVTYVGLEDSSYISNAFIDCYLGENAKLNFNKIQNDSNNAVTLYHLNTKLKRDADFNFSSYHFGSKSSRDEITVDLNGRNANADLNGLYVVNKDRKTHQKITVNHNVERCTSTQLFKGIISDEARAEFNGMIDVKKDAQLTDAKQLNNNLLLSTKAHIDSRPQLNILADDVKCAHGSTVGQLNEEELFYLRSRGFTQADAFTTLTYSFCEEILKKIKLESAKNYATNLAFNNIASSENNLLAKLAQNDKFKKSRYTG